MGGIDFCVVGLGRMGRMRLELLRDLPGSVRITGLCDFRAEAAQAAESRYGIPVHRDAREMLERSKPHALVIATPPANHPEIIAAAASLGIHIFCEKPLALGRDEAEAVAAAVEKNGVLFQMGFQRRFDAAYRSAAGQIRSGALGELLTFKSIGRDSWKPDPDYARPDVSGGLLLDMGIHDFDLARWLMGSEVRTVYAQGSNRLYPELSAVGDVDNALVSLSFESGAIGNVEIGRTGTFGYDIRTEIVGTQGATFVGAHPGEGLAAAGQDGTRSRAFSGFEERFGEAFMHETRAFVACVEEERAPECGLREGTASLEIALAAARSLASGNPEPVRTPARGGGISGRF